MLFIEQITAYQPQNEQESADKAAILALIHQQPETILLRENKLAHVTSSGFIVNRALSKTLLIHHNLYHSWGWTGGHADGDEDLARVACKEAKEETGVTVQLALPRIVAIDILPVFSHQKNGGFVGAHLHFNVSYLLFADDTQSLRSKPDENSAAAWFLLDEFQDYVSEAHMQPIYQKLKEKVKINLCGKK